MCSKTQASRCNQPSYTQRSWLCRELIIGLQISSTDAHVTPDTFILNVFPEQIQEFA